MKSLELLLIEDSHGDVVLVKEALKQTAVPVSFNVVYDGDAALAYLRKEAPYTQALDQEEVLYFPNARARLHRHGGRVNYEPDFLIFNRDGPQHRWRGEEDNKRDRLFKAYGIRVIERFSDTECREKPALVVQQFLFLLQEAYC